jgi:hypothetical protein
LALVPAALAAGPTTVTVRAVGSSDQPVLGLTQVTTNETPVVKDGNSEHSCAGTSAAGALQLASKGEWGGGWSAGFGYGVEAIEGVNYPFGNQDRWAFWLDNQPAPSGTGVCGAELNTGDSVLFFAECVSKETGVCPSTAPGVLAIEVPATVEVKQPVTVTVMAYPGAGGAPAPAKGVTVVGGGDTSAPPTDEQGQTTLVFAGEGQYTIDADGSGMGPAPISAEAFVCAHEGNDGACGTPAPPGTSPVQTGGGGSTTAGGKSVPAVTPTGGVALAGSTVMVRGGAMALVKLECLGIASCHGKLTLSVAAKVAATAKAKGKKRPARTVRIGSASYSIAGDSTKTVKLHLNAAGRALLVSAHGRLRASLAILELSPGPKNTQTKTVQLVLHEHVKLDERAQGILLGARRNGLLSVRGQHRSLRVARTIADLAHSERVEARHLQYALSLRPPVSLVEDDVR